MDKSKYAVKLSHVTQSGHKVLKIYINDDELMRLTNEKYFDVRVSYNLGHILLVESAQNVGWKFANIAQRSTSSIMNMAVLDFFTKRQLLGEFYENNVAHCFEESTGKLIIKITISKHERPSDKYYSFTKQNRRTAKVTKAEEIKEEKPILNIYETKISYLKLEADI